MDYNEQALRFRLDALACPFLSTLDLSDPLHQQKLICWLEDVHIRLLPPSSRAPLRCIPFLPALDAYLSTFPSHIPHPSSSPLPPLISFLTDLALRLCYSDNPTVYNRPHDPWHNCSIPVLPSISTSPTVDQAVTHLLQTLRVQEKPPDSMAGAELAAQIVNACFGDDAQPADGMLGKDNKEVLDELPLGFTTGDEAVDRFAKIVRVLHVRQLRELQDEINDAVARMQQVTANPKTDVKLGKVGR